MKKILFLFILLVITSCFPTQYTNDPDKTSYNIEMQKIKNDGGEILYTLASLYNQVTSDGTVPSVLAQDFSFIIEYVIDSTRYVKVIVDRTPEKLQPTICYTLKVNGYISNEDALNYTYQCTDVKDNKLCTFTLVTESEFLFLFKKEQTIRVFKAYLNNMKIPKDK